MDAPMPAFVHVIRPRRRPHTGAHIRSALGAASQFLAPAIAGCVAAYVLLAGAGYAPASMDHLGQMISADSHPFVIENPRG